MDKLAEGALVPDDAAAVARMFAFAASLFHLYAEATRDLGAAHSPEVVPCRSDPYLSMCFVMLVCSCDMLGVSSLQQLVRQYYYPPHSSQCLVCCYRTWIRRWNRLWPVRAWMI